MEEVASTWSAKAPAAAFAAGWWAAAFAAGLGAAAVVVEEGEEAVGPVKELAVGSGGGLFQVITFFIILLSRSTWDREFKAIFVDS